MRDWSARAQSGEELPVAEKLGVMVSEGRVALCMGRVNEAIASLLAALDLADRTDHREMELELHDLLAVACKQAGRLSEALEHRERHFALHREIFTDAADLRMRTVRVAHDNENARHLGQITRLTTSGLVADFATGHSDVDAYHLEAFERLAALAEMRGAARRGTRAASVTSPPRSGMPLVNSRNGANASDSPRGSTTSARLP